MIRGLSKSAEPKSVAIVQVGRRLRRLPTMGLPRDIFDDRSVRRTDRTFDFRSAELPELCAFSSHRVDVRRPAMSLTRWFGLTVVASVAGAPQRWLSPYRQSETGPPRTTYASPRRIMTPILSVADGSDTTARMATWNDPGHRRSRPPPHGPGADSDSDSEHSQGFDRWRKESAIGSVGTGIARGLQSVFGAPPQEIAIVAEVPGEPPDADTRLRVILDPDDPSKSIAVVPSPPAEPPPA